MKVIDKLWFTTRKGLVGIIVGEDKETKERKSYIGIGTGQDEEIDAKEIMEWGAKFPEDLIDFSKVSAVRQAVSPETDAS